MNWFRWLLLWAVVLCHAAATPKCRPFTSAEVDALFRQSADVEQTRNDVELELTKQGKVIKSNQKVADLCLLRQKNHDPLTRMRELKQLPFDTVTTKLIEKYKLSPSEISDCLPSVPLQCASCGRARNACGALIVQEGGGRCDPGSRFRTADGTCNNLNRPGWGAAGACFRRLLPARYEGEFGFRQSVAGGPLPEPRDLSLRVHGHLYKPTNGVTHMYMFFGQLLDHDITQAPFSVTVDNEPIQCCGDGSLHPQCAPISVRPSDPFYAQFGTTCINFVRSAVCPTCTLGTRQQTNQITAFIDASFVYGNSLNDTNMLRTNDGTGRMRVERSSVGDLLPSSPDPVNDQCSFVNTSDICFLAGDSRANQHTTLASLHTIFTREHNRLADGLRRVNPAWDDERIFQEARRILGAEMQVITYKEYLPITLGRERTGYFDLWLKDRERTQYDPTTDPTLFNEFSGAAFRFGHSLIGSVVTDSPRTSSNEPRTLRDEFFQPWSLRAGILDPLLAGVARTPAQWFDRHLVPDVTNYLYRIRGQPAGLDLASINIQRGRDHGLPSYTDAVRYCSEGEIVINTFRDLVSREVTSAANARLLAQNYRSVHDVDLWTGILSETPNEGVVVGPTGACIVGAQFHNLKFGDRFYFEHANQAGSFTFQQVQQLREMSLSKIICLNTNVKQIPLNAMLFNSRKNPLITCSYIRGVDLSYWRAA
ncbi:hypothetical protein JTE90_003837 [Oedothorax gibbosus]|uniref:Peroxidase n=1 Tax=Oedothorax gibbosus TaxID=931172 RepID=A0AAV6TZB2_9ARAC|nr:hypothetical protein JTE90_003837 [Oedothorax gibbosus]